MEDGMKYTELLAELNEVQSKIDSLKTEKSRSYTPRAMSVFFISSFHLILGIILMGLFLWGVYSDFNQWLVLIFFIGSFLGLFPFITDIFTKKEYISLKYVGGVVLIILSGAYMLLWTEILNKYIDTFFYAFTIILFISIFFFIIHAYIAYLKRIATKEIRILSLIALTGFILFLVQLMAMHFLILTIYFLVIGLFLKGVIDLIQRFRIKK